MRKSQGREDRGGQRKREAEGNKTEGKNIWLVPSNVLRHGP